MKAVSDCIICLFQQTINTIRLVDDHPDHHLEVIKKVAKHVETVSLDQTPAALSKFAYEAVTNVTGVLDPYDELKKETNRVALSLEPKLRKLIHQSDDPLDMALHVAVAGNIIDLGIGYEYDLEKDIDEIGCNLGDIIFKH